MSIKKYACRHSKKIFFLISLLSVIFLYFFYFSSLEDGARGQVFVKEIKDRQKRSDKTVEKKESLTQVKNEKVSLSSKKQGRILDEIPDIDEALSKLKIKCENKTSEILKNPDFVDPQSDLYDFPEKRLEDLKKLFQEIVLLDEYTNLVIIIEKKMHKE